MLSSPRPARLCCGSPAPTLRPGVRALQLQNGMVPDGEVGPATRSLLGL